MKLIHILTVAAAFSTSVLIAGCGGHNSPPTIGNMNLSFANAEKISPAELDSIGSNATVQNYLAGKFDDAGGSTASATTGSVNTVLPGHDVVLPHTTQAPVSDGERFLLKSYLNHPQDPTLASFLALVSLNKSLLTDAGKSNPGDAIKYTILSQYFLGRAKELGKTSAWIQVQLNDTQNELDKVLNKASTITSDESHEAHKYYREAFHFGHEENRYIALDGLLQDFADKPGNVYTSFALNAVNAWIGGESDSDDPTALENFVLGSYFSVHAMKLAKQVEVAWLADHNSMPRFRMAPTLGGFSIMHRRWLANLHGQKEAIAVLDNEHRQWRLKQRAFHSFTVGLTFFDDPKNFAEGQAAWLDGFTHCGELKYELRTCQDQPRFAHNTQGYVLGYVDFLLKSGDTQTAAGYLAIRHRPDLLPDIKHYETWDLGRAAWEYREQHLNEIAASYTDNNPANNPRHLFLKSRMWGNDTATCQVCHQAQSSKFTEQEKQSVTLPDESVATIGTWPEVSTTWYGSLPVATAK